MSDTSNDDDNSGIQPLRGENNFYTWKAIVTLHLMSLDLWKITCGVTPRPTVPESAAQAPTPAQEAWDQASLLARYFLGRHISKRVNQNLYIHETAPALWKALMDLYHRRDAHSLLTSFNAVCSLRYDDTSTDSFPDHLDLFEEYWNDLVCRTADADPPIVGAGNSLETALRVIATSGESKREFLIASLPPSMTTFVFNLQSLLGSELTYNHLCRELLSFHTQQEDCKEELTLEELPGPDGT